MACYGHFEQEQQVRKFSTYQNKKLHIITLSWKFETLMLLSNIRRTDGH